MAAAGTSKLSANEVVLNELDEFALQWNERLRSDRELDCRRGRHRRKLRAECDVWFYENAGGHVRQLKARTRNLSEQGVGLVIKCVVLQGIPIEIRIQLPDKPPTHLAGVVAFCRYAHQGYHEIGIQLYAHQNKPIFSEDPSRARSSIPWIQKALRHLANASSIGRLKRSGKV